MSRKVQVNLFGALGDREVDITPNGFPTRHVLTGAPVETPTLAITPHLPKPAPVIPAFSTAWNANKQRVFDFLAEGFSNLSESILLDAFGEAITEPHPARR